MVCWTHNWYISILLYTYNSDRVPPPSQGLPGVESLPVSATGACSRHAPGQLRHCWVVLHLSALPLIKPAFVAECCGEGVRWGVHHS